MFVKNLGSNELRASKNRQQSTASALQQDDAPRPTVPTQKSSGVGNVDDEPSSSKYQKLVPRPDDEPNLVCKVLLQKIKMFHVGLLNFCIMISWMECFS